MPEFKRVKHPLFGEYSTASPIVGDMQEVDKPATYANGRPLPAKPKVSVAAKATESKKNTPTNGDEPADPSEKDSK